jgi:DNA-binding IclR family transcriptional regulator
VDDTVDSWSVKYGRPLYPAEQRNLVGAVLKAVVLIESFLGGRSELTLTELAQRSGYPTPTAHRLLATLESAGWVTRGPSGGYRLSLHMAEIGRHVLSGIDLRECALSPMQELTQRTGETAYLVVREADHAVCIDRMESYNMVRVMSWDVGSVLPLYAGAAPLALLAFTPPEDRARLLGDGPLEPPLGVPVRPEEVEARLVTIRTKGFSVSSEETIPGIASFGAPVFADNGKVVAGISVGGLASTMMIRDRVDTLAEAVRKAGQAISIAMGYRGAYPPQRA